ncbi:MAG: DUF2271 domain-containing protein, partial [Candidatus Kapabacteria bacterium]|nr:DUF2271 domain-containing protein [Candidatus Kapabacteria bacterium]
IISIIVFTNLSIAKDPISLCEGSVNVEFTTATYWGEFAPDHIIAVWVEDSEGIFIRTLQIWTQEKSKHLIRWNNASNGNKVDAITSATLRSHKQMSVAWDCTDLHGEFVPDGTYKIVIELTEDASEKDKKIGKFIEMDFVKGGENISKTYNEENFKDVTLSYTFLTSVDETTTDNMNNYSYPNPTTGAGTIKYHANASEFVTVNLVDISGNIVDNLFEGYSQIGENTLSVDLSSFQAGAYFYNISSKSVNVSGKIIKE